jgi:probable HAF family extracellular repeat protein
MRRLGSAAIIGAGLLLALVPAASAAPFTLITFDAPFPEVRFTAASGINDAGVIVGVYGDDRGEHGFVYARGAFRSFDVPFPGATGTTPQGINNRGQVVGTYRDALGSFHGFLYDRGRFSALDVPLAMETSPSGINDRGEVVGIYCEELASGACRPHGFHFHEGRFSALDAPFAGAIATRAFGINNDGQIVGDYDDELATRPYFYDGGLFRRIGDMEFSVTGRGINDRGQIVGVFFDGEHHSFLYQGGQFRILPVSASAEALGINNRGQIVGTIFEDGRARGYVVTGLNRAAAPLVRVPDPGILAPR